MSQTIIFFIGGVVGAVAVRIFWRGRKGSKNSLEESAPVEPKQTLIEKQAEEKQRNKEAILGLLETQGKLTNNHVEMMLGISDATAERYLQELEEEGKAKQVGTTGCDVFYEKI